MHRKSAPDYIYTYSDEELRTLKSKIREKPCYTMFNNHTMKDDALRFMKICGRG